MSHAFGYKWSIDDHPNAIRFKIQPGGGIRRLPPRTITGARLIDPTRTKSTVDDLTPADTPFRPGRDVFSVRRGTSRPIIRISKRAPKKIAPKPEPREEKRFQISPIERVVFDVAQGPIFRPSVPGAPVPKAIAKVETPGPATEKSEVSLHKSILKGLRSGIQQSVTTRVQQKFSPAAIMPAIGAVGRVLTGRVATAGGIGAAVGSLFGGGGGGGNGGACPSGEHLNKQDGKYGPAGTYCVKNRRMNFGNARAARRGVRRLKGARKLLRDIEKMMPSKTRARRAPQHHHHPAAGGG